MNTRVRCSWSLAIVALLVFSTGTASGADHSTMTITYENGKTQAVSLDQTSSRITAIRFGSAGSSTHPDPVKPTDGDDSPKPGTYTDTQGEEVLVPFGKTAFADRVVSFQPGNPGPEDAYRRPERALGEPDWKSDSIPAEATLGTGGSITLEFTKVAVIDGEGPDIHVFEAGGSVEATILEISKDGRTWIDLGQISGGKASVDLRGKVAAGDRFPFVRLTDVNKRDSGTPKFSGTPGADIDAVAAINAVLR